MDNATITQTTKYAGFWIRFLAVLLDGLIFIIPSFILDFICFILFFPVEGVGYMEYMFSGIYYLSYEVTSVILLMVLSALYSVLMVSSKYQGTLGKMIVGIKVVSDKGDRLTFGRALGRYFAKILSSLTLNIGYLMVAWTKQKQGLHDEVAKTYVVYK